MKHWLARSVLFLGGLAGGFGPAFAQEPAPATAPIPVQLRHAGSDPVGYMLAGAVSQALAIANGLRHATEADGARMVLILTTVDGSVKEPGQLTAAAISVLYDSDSLPLNGYLVTGLVQVCGTERTTACADEIVGSVAAAVGRLEATEPALWQSLQPVAPAE